MNFRPFWNDCVATHKNNVILYHCRLDALGVLGKAKGAMKTLALAASAAVALLSLSACNQQKEPEVLDSRAPDPMAEQLKNAAPVELPPAVAATVTFRCQPGNGLLYVEFYQGDKQAVLKTTKDGPPTILKAPAAGEPYVADNGSKITGNSKSASISVAGAAAKSCSS
jgi:hypothetical protein